MFLFDPSSAWNLLYSSLVVGMLGSVASRSDLKPFQLTLRKLNLDFLCVACGLMTGFMPIMYLIYSIMNGVSSKFFDG